MFQCGPSVQKLKFKFSLGPFSVYYGDDYIGCVGGCDPLFLKSLDIKLSSVRPTQGELI